MDTNCDMLRIIPYFVHTLCGDMGSINAQKIGSTLSK